MAKETAQKSVPAPSARPIEVLVATGSIQLQKKHGIPITRSLQLY